MVAVRAAIDFGGFLTVDTCTGQLPKASQRWDSTPQCRRSKQARFTVKDVASDAVVTNKLRARRRWDGCMIVREQTVLHLVVEAAQHGGNEPSSDNIP